MTREEAILIIGEHKKNAERLAGKTLAGQKSAEAFNTAIEALSAEPCEDTISRQAVLDAFNLSEKTRKYGGDHSGYDTMMLYEIQDVIEDLPSVTPKQKMCFDGMTNGEVIGLLFPNAVIYHNRDFTLREMIFPDEWWDAPYKAESEDTE